MKTKSKVVATDTSGLSFVLHPLPLLNISDFYTRGKSRGQKHYIGVLLGTRSDREVIIENAFELKAQEEATNIDQDFLNRKLELYKQTFPSHEALGWFHVRPGMSVLEPDEESLAIHEQMMGFFDMPVMMLFAPQGDTESSQLPVKAFELIFKEKTVEFAEIPVRVETGDAERIGVEDITKGAQAQGGHGRHLDVHLTTETNAIKMFYSRLKIVRDYVVAVKQQKVPMNHEVMRQIDSFIARLSNERDPHLQSLLDEQQLSVLTSALLAAITKAEYVNMDMTAKRQVAMNGTTSSVPASTSHHQKRRAPKRVRNKRD